MTPQPSEGLSSPSFIVASGYRVGSAMDPETFDPDGRFRAAVSASLAADPMPTFTQLAANVGVPVEDLIHYALFRWVSAGSEALMSGPPEVFADLARAVDDGDLERVRGIVRFLLAGFEEAPDAS